MVHDAWFTFEPSPTVQTPALTKKLLALLDELQPADLDRARSRIAVTGEDQLKGLLAHKFERRADIDFDISSRGGTMMSVDGFEDYYGDYGDDGPLEKVFLSDLADRLRAEWTIEQTYLGNRLVRTVATGPRAESYSGWIVPPRWLIPARFLRTVSCSGSYNCRGFAARTRP